MHKFLPVGSVVLLKGATQGVVVIGYNIVEEGSKDVWDYLGCAYPIGVLSSDKNLLFNREQIEKVLFTGYMDEEGSTLCCYCCSSFLINSWPRSGGGQDSES